MKFVRHAHRHSLFSICLLAFIFTFHVALPMYLNSSYLSRFTSDQGISLVYAAGSLLTMISFFAISKILRRFGNYATTMVLIIIQAIVTLGIVFYDTFALTAVFFIIAAAAINLIIFALDIFLEDNSDDIHTGGIRGLYLTVVNIAWILSPMLAGALVDGNDYKTVYLASALLLIPFAYLLKVNFGSFKDPTYDHLTVHRTLGKMWHDKNFYRISLSNILLHFFYAWMVIFTPIYLHEHIGFDWESIGIIFTIMLVPFILLELPLGRLADRKLGEKELLSLGFVIVALSTILMSFITVKNIWVWGLILFITRIGASMVEIMNETYFFKKIDGSSSSLLSLFRMTRPVAYLVAPLVATVALTFLDFRYLFALLGIILLYGLRYSLTLKDTK